MNGGIIATNYAKALFAHARTTGKTEEVYTYLTSLEQAILGWPRLRRILAEGAITPDTAVRIAAAAVPSALPAEVERFLRLVAENRRMEHLLGMCLKYIELYTDANGLLNVSLTTAIEPDPALLEKIGAKAAEMTRKKVVLQTHVDPAIRGGYTLRWKDRLLDASVKGRLERIEKALTQNKDL